VASSKKKKETPNHYLKAHGAGDGIGEMLQKKGTLNLPFELPRPCLCVQVTRSTSSGSTGSSWTCAATCSIHAIPVHSVQSRG
jgi:hypothetical protein